MEELNTLLNIVHNIQIYQKKKNGSEKKEYALKLVDKQIHSDVIRAMAPDLIDFFICLSRNKKFIKSFKKNCSCLNK